MKSSMRTSRPSAFSPEGVVTVTVVGRTFDGDPPPRPPRPPPGIRNVFCRVLGSENFDAIPFRSPVAEWHEAHLVLKTSSPAFASPTRMLGGVIREIS